jgi:hypothetical protein
MVGATGFEPVTKKTLDADDQSVIRDSIPSVTHIASQTFVITDPNLEKIIQTWPYLAPETQEAIQSIAR